MISNNCADYLFLVVHREYRDCVRGGSARRKPGSDAVDMCLVGGQ